MEDTALQVLKTTILTGWPETKEEVPVITREYWAYRDELTVQNGVLFKGPRVIIPKSMRPEIIIIIIIIINLTCIALFLKNSIALNSRKDKSKM